MISTIEVPISLIKAGDIDAIRELLPKPSLFGRWAAQVEDRHNLPDSGSDLIAEKRAHAKLRAEVEKLRDRKLSLSKTQYQTARDLKNGIFDETFGTMPETHTVEAWEMGARTNQRTATALTRILEVDNG